MTRLHSWLGVAAGLAALGTVAAGQVPAPEPVDSVVARARADVAALAGPAFRGRGYLDDGHARAAAYLRERFAEAGLEPVAGSYLHPFELAPDVFPETPRLAVDERALRPGFDFLPYPSSASGQAPEGVPVVDVGLGLAFPERGLNDFAGVRAEGAVLVMDAAVPDSLTAGQAPETAYRATRDGRLQIAAWLRARAVVFRVDRLAFGPAPRNADLPAFDVLRSAWPDDARRVRFRVRSRRDRPVTAYNVVGLVRGTARPDSLIVIGAHYDHLGALGEEVVFPGANDNASGTAMLLALARDVARRPLRYTVVFAAFSGEEEGLVGSRHFVEQPPVDLDRCRFMLNFDMVASAEAGVMAVGGADHPEAFARLDSVNAALGLGPLGRRAQAPNSDQFAFARRGIPAFYLYTNRGRQPYHHPDDVPGTLEWDDFRHVFELARRFLRTL